MEDQVLIINHELFRLATIHAIDDFNSFRKNVLGEYLQEITIDSQFPVIYLGSALAVKLNIAILDTVVIAAPKQINIFTGLPPKRSMIVGGIYELEVLDYDQKHIFTHYSSVRDFLPDIRSVYYLHEIPGGNFLNSITQVFPKLTLHTWESEHQSFISAMKVEKVTYSVIGFIIVGIAGFTLMSMMSLAVIQKVPQIGILRAMGAKKQNISAIFIIQAFITWIISSITGIMLSLIIIELNKDFHLIKYCFRRSLF